MYPVTLRALAGLLVVIKGQSEYHYQAVDLVSFSHALPAAEVRTDAALLSTEHLVGQPLAPGDGLEPATVGNVNGTGLSALQGRYPQ